MAVYGEDFQNDPDYEAGLSDCSCVKTSTALGPDQGTVNLKACSDPDRDCYQEY
jgi:hypothetical protein